MKTERSLGYGLEKGLLAKVEVEFLCPIQLSVRLFLDTKVFLSLL